MTSKIPQAEDIEKAVLGAMLTSEEDIHVIADLVNKDCFYDKEHAKIYSTCIEIYNKGKVPEGVSDEKRVTKGTQDSR